MRYFTRSSVAISVRRRFVPMRGGSAQRFGPAGEAYDAEQSSSAAVGDWRDASRQISQGATDLQQCYVNLKYSPSVICFSAATSKELRSQNKKKRRCLAGAFFRRRVYFNTCSLQIHYSFLDRILRPMINKPAPSSTKVEGSGTPVAVVAVPPGHVWPGKSQLDIVPLIISASGPLLRVLILKLINSVSFALRSGS